MRLLNFQFGKYLVVAVAAITCVSVMAEPPIDYKHGYAFLAEPALPENFTHLGYANPNAPKGGRIRRPLQGTWDNFNSFVEGAKGRQVDGMHFWLRDRNLVYDTLLTPALDEPATYYGVLAEGVAFPEDRSWVAFKLRSEARWHDGMPLTTADVEFTVNALHNSASPTIRTSYKHFRFEAINEREFRFFIPEFFRRDPSVVFTLGIIPIMPKHYWESRDLIKTTVEPPLGSGPYRIGKFSIGRWVEYERVKDYWGADLPTRKGLFNFDIVKYDYFRDDQIRTEALKGHVVDINEESVPRTWSQSYNTPAFNAGLIKKTRHRLLKPAGLWWPVFWNLDQPRFQDIRIRKALWLLRDEVWGARRSYGFFDHAVSFFHDSELAATGLPDERELKLLEPFRGQIPEAVFTTPYEPQPNTGAGWSRDNILTAARLLEEAGWVVKDNRLVHHKTGEQFHIRFVAVSPALAASFLSFAKLLERLGITSSIKAPEISNWLFRMRAGDFDAGAIWFLPTYTPTLLVKNSFHSAEADKGYGSNWSNLRDPAVDAMIDAMQNAPNWDEYVAAIKAFDRIMLHNYYWQPMASNTRRAYAYWDKFGMPEHGRLRRMAFIDNWRWDENKAAAVEAFTGGNK